MKDAQTRPETLSHTVARHGVLKVRARILLPSQKNTQCLWMISEVVSMPVGTECNGTSAAQLRSLQEWRTFCFLRQVRKPRDVVPLMVLSCTPRSLLRILPVVLEHILPFLTLSELSRFSRSNPALRFLTGTINWLHYCLSHIQPLTAVRTRRCFFLPAKTKLRKLREGRARYAQDTAFCDALVHCGGIHGIRRAFERRCHLRNMARARVERYRRRLYALREALVSANVPVQLMWTTQAGLSFRRMATWLPENLIGFYEKDCVEHICYHWYLMQFTEFPTLLREYMELHGPVHDAYNNVAQLFPRPQQWPWQPQRRPLRSVVA